MKNNNQKSLQSLKSTVTVGMKFDSPCKTSHLMLLKLNANSQNWALTT